MPPLSKLKIKPEPARPKAPVWKGPEKDGITFSLLSRFLVCRERFRCLAVEGLRPADGFNHRLEYGNMWHVCEEAVAANLPWHHELAKYAEGLGRRYPIARDEIEHWYSVCRIQFPEYIKHWAGHPDVTDRRPLLQEQVFDVPYRLPSGRTVRLRGKWDSVDVVGKGKAAGVYLQENKTKGDIDPTLMQRQLKFDLQTMLYLVALRHEYDRTGWAAKGPLAGVRYNVVRRPLSGGKGSIRQHQPTKSNPLGESREAFYERLRKDYIAAEPEHFFMRWKVEVSPQDVNRFREQCLDPILENLVDWWDCMDPPAKQNRPINYYTPMNWQHPFGVWNPLDEGGATDLDEYLATGSTVGLTRTNNLFPELTNAGGEQTEQQAEDHAEPDPDLQHPA